MESAINSFLNRANLMKKVLLGLLLCIGVQPLHAKYIMLDSLRFDIYHTYKQKMVLHEGKTSQEMFLCEFVEKDTLYIISNAFILDYNEYMHDVPDVLTLVSELMSIYPEEGDCDGCGYVIKIDGFTPATLTLSTIKDIIQYTTIPSPDFLSAVIEDSLYGSSNIKCGVSIQRLLNNLSINALYYDYTKYNHIVLIPEDFTYSTYHKKGYADLSSLCFQLRIKDGMIDQIMTKRSKYSEKVVKKFSQIYEYMFY